MYLVEGSVHLYSGMPTVLTPADLYVAKGDPGLRECLSSCNIYIVASRPRILIAREIELKGDVAHGNFLVHRSGAAVKIPFEWPITNDVTGTGAPVEAVEVLATGTHVLVTSAGVGRLCASNLLVSCARSTLTQEDRDLMVLYVGQAIGRSTRRSALDRLWCHSTLQRVLAEASTYDPNTEVLLLLYRFDDASTIVSTGGDLTADSQASHSEDLAHLDRLHKWQLTQRAKVALAEAGLIRHFQPQFNALLVASDFTAKKKLKALQGLMSQGITGLIVEVCSSNISSRLCSSAAPPLDMSTYFSPEALRGDNLTGETDKLAWSQQLHAMTHSQYASFPLTTPKERDSFMHGIVWQGHQERERLF
ncbi:hypothetical protein [Paraburkholderia phytofirmans]|nr:hypothetical protein [Paraburkholderia phytofirmans]